MRKLVAMAIVAMVSVLIVNSPALAQSTNSGPTDAPDLVSVGNFREGPPTDNGTPQTLVDYTFDQMAYLNGGDRSSFHLVPLDAGDALDARGVEPAADTEGDEVVTVLFNGNLLPADYARGYLDTGVINSDPSDVSSANPANINQSADISPNIVTENPDLVRVRRGGESLLYEFDEALTDDDVVQSTSGLRIYFAETSQSSTIRQKGAIRVERVNNTTLRAFFGSDLPEGKTLSDAVGAFANQGTVQAAQGSRGGNDGKNAFDEVLLDSTCTIEGTSGDDVLVGTPGRDVICGLGGDDEIRGLGGNDEIRGGAGDDTRLAGGPGTDRILGQAGDDKLFGNAGNDILRGGAGQDRLVGGAGDDDLAGGEGVDRIFGQAGKDKLFGQAGDDILRGGANQDRLVGGDGNDNLVGGDGADKLFGIAGSDVLRGSAGDDRLVGGAGEDNLKDTNGADKLFGQAGNDFLNSEDGKGNDVVDGGNGRDGCVTDQGDTTRNCP